MAARAIWKGIVKVGSIRIPVKLYSAVQDRTVRFHVLDDRHLMRIKQHMVDRDTGEEVSNEEIQKGYEVEPGRFVVLTEEELEAIKPEAAREIDVSEFVSPEQISQQWYERPYYLGPDGDQKNYFALAQALANRQVEGVAQWVMRNKSYVGALRSEQGYLFLVTLRSAGEVITARELPKPAGPSPVANELAMAKTLVAMLAGEFNPADYQDEYRERVMEFIERKAQGKAPRLRAVKAKPKTGSLDTILKKSLETLKKGKRAA